MSFDANTLFKLFGKIHNHIYANDGLSPQEALNEFTKILFVKIYSDKNSKQINESTANKVFETILSDYPTLFESNDKIKLKEKTLAYALKELANINLSSIDDDVKGIAFQKFIFSTQRGDRGQFLTPDPIIDLVVNCINPKSSFKLIDPACGTGGFLIQSLRYMKKIEGKEFSKLANNITGIEISPSIIKLAKIRMVLEGDGNSKIILGDSLENINALFTSNKAPNEYDLVLTNPPFGIQGKIEDPTYLKNFELAQSKNDSSLNKAQPPEILFIERCINLLKDGGRLAIVLPDGILENKTAKFVRDFIRKKTKVLGIISMPSETFIPHGTGIKTSILFLQKSNSKKESKDYKVFFGIIKNVGYYGDKNATPKYKTDKDGTQILDEDMTIITNHFKKFENGDSFKFTDKYYLKNFSELEDRLDAEFYMPRFEEIISYLKSKKAVPLNELVEIKSKKSTKLKDNEATIRYVEITDINSEGSEISSATNIKVADAPSRASYELEPDEIITEVAGVSTGTQNHATAIVTNEFSGAICTNGFRVLKSTKIDPYFLLYYLKSDLFLNQMLKYRIGAAIPSVLEEDLGKILVLLPSKETIANISKDMKKLFKLKAEVRTETTRLLSKDNNIFSKYK